FRPKIGAVPRGRFALYKHPQLITVEKWRKLQHDVDGARLPTQDVLELHRLAGKVFPRDKRIPVVEVAILIESKLRQYAEAVLPECGFSKSKIKDLQHDLTFNTLLNLVLPLTLTKSELRKVTKSILHVDR